jgi:hypothetical protein
MDGEDLAVLVNESLTGCAFPKRNGEVSCDTKVRTTRIQLGWETRCTAFQLNAAARPAREQPVVPAASLSPKVITHMWGSSEAVCPSTTYASSSRPRNMEHSSTA